MQYTLWLNLPYALVLLISLDATNNPWITPHEVKVYRRQNKKRTDREGPSSHSGSADPSS